MQTTNDISWYSISQYRTQLMGLAALCVMLFHSNVLPYGWGGVEIFIFVSALGCYNSLSKQDGYFAFLKKRLLRIFPAYIIILAGVHICSLFVEHFVPESARCLVYPHSLWEAVLFYTTLGYWIPDASSCTYDWYVPAILSFYIVMPFIYKASKWCQQHITSNICLLTLLFLFVGYLFSCIVGGLLEKNGMDLLRYDLSLNRIPLLLAGFVVATVVLNKERSSGDLGG